MPLCKCGTCVECVDEADRKSRLRELAQEKKRIENCAGQHMHPEMAALKREDERSFKKAYRPVKGVIERVEAGGG